jgi:glycosyltransferase involved in cell wall biosynthesis
MKSVAILRGYPEDAAYLRVVRALADEYQVACFLWDRKGDFQPPFIHQNVIYRLFKVRAGYHNLRTFLKIPFFNLWLLWRLLFAKVDLIHAIDLDTGIAGFIAARLKGKKFVYQCLDPYYAALPKTWPRFLSGLVRKIESFIISHADLFIITDMLRMPQHDGAYPKKLVEIANVPIIDVELAATAREECFVVGYIGTLAEGRNLTVIIEAVGELAEEGVRLIIGGFGPLEDQLRELAGRYENVSFTSWVPYEKLLELERLFDVFILTLDIHFENVYWGSASPNKLFESMAFGRPIIVDSETLSVQKVQAFGNGLAIKYGVKDELKEAIRYLKDNPLIAQEMGERGRSIYLLEFNMKVMSDRLLIAYSELNLDTQNVR